MVYDDDTGRRVHLSLPLESMKELAARMSNRPLPAIVDAIARAVRRRAKGPNRPKVSPSRIKSDLRRSQIDVTVEQVAWVMVNEMRAPEVTQPPRPRSRQQTRTPRRSGKTRE
ncbi:hypothetical protein JCM9533A_77980 [Catenuloplanes niger JCM 9533]